MQQCEKKEQHSNVKWTTQSFEKNDILITNSKKVEQQLEKTNSTNAQRTTIICERNIKTMQWRITLKQCEEKQHQCK
jgi:S-adenosylmethionine:tRNA-ribosyltransferase-isomerase (queuine synthetase)